VKYLINLVSHRNVSIATDSPIAIEVILNSVYQKTDSIPAHIPALIVEIKVLILHVREFELSHLALIGILNRLFVALLVDEVDQSDRTVS
jgi:hypothetical protein